VVSVVVIESLVPRRRSVAARAADISPLCVRY